MTAAASSSPGPQRLRALERVNALRLARAELKRRIAAGHLSAAEEFLSRNQINETKPLHALTQRQRRLLASELSFCLQQSAETEPALSA